MKPLLELQHVQKIFDDGGEIQTVLDDINLSVYAGEAVAIVGASGCGKTTMAKAIAGFTDISSGKIIFDDADITNIKGSKRREVYQKMQMVFQQPQASFNPRRTLGFSIGEALLNKKMAKSERIQTVKNLMQQCSLAPEFFYRYPQEVSGGQCQRASIARAIALRPRLLLCDECTSALDTTTQAQIISLLNDLKCSYKMTVLFICHNLALAQAFCDRIIVMHEGKIVEQGSADAVICAPQSKYTKQLLNAVL